MSESNEKKLYCRYCKKEIENPKQTPYCSHCFSSLQEYQEFIALKKYVNELYEKENPTKTKKTISRRW